MSNKYDAVFRTLIHDCPNLIIPFVNEVFGEHYSPETPIIFHPNDHFINQMDGNLSERITDTCFEILGDVPKKYHIECQSTADSSMLIRMFEYGAQIALDEGELHYEVAVVNIHSYTLDEIFQKKLLFLIPFYIFIHEKSFPVYNENEEQLNILKNEYKLIQNRLEVLSISGEITEYTKRILTELSANVIEQLTNKYAHVQKGVSNIMLGPVIETKTKKIYDQGISQGKRDSYLELIREGLITISIAAEKLGLTEDEVKKLIE